MAKKRNSDQPLDPHRMRAIAFRDGVQMQEVVDILNSPVLTGRMPEDVQTYSGKANNGRRVLWACRQLKMLAEHGRLDLEKQLFSDKPAEVEGLEERIRQLETLEVDYVKAINDQIREGKERDRLLAFYRKVVADNGITVDENSRKYKGKYDDYWTVPAV